MCGSAIPGRVPETRHIAIDIDFLERFGMRADPGRHKAEVPIGGMRCRTRRPNVDGQPLQVSAAAELSRRRQKSYTASRSGWRRGTPDPKPPAMDKAAGFPYTVANLDPGTRRRESAARAHPGHDLPRTAQGL